MPPQEMPPQEMPLQEMPPQEMTAWRVAEPGPLALAALDRGGTLSIAGIHLSDVPMLDYQKHLFGEREVRSVTANTRDDGRRFLGEAAEADVQVHVQPYALGEADVALADLWGDRVNGAAVLRTPHA